jgi:hypothetical protein
MQHNGMAGSLSAPGQPLWLSTHGLLLPNQNHRVLSQARSPHGVVDPAVDTVEELGAAPASSSVLMWQAAPHSAHIKGTDTLDLTLAGAKGGSPGRG